MLKIKAADTLQEFAELEFVKKCLENSKTEHLFFPSGNLFWDVEDGGDSEIDTETFKKQCTEIGRWDNDFSSHNPFFYKSEVERLFESFAVKLK